MPWHACRVPALHPTGSRSKPPAIRTRTEHTISPTLLLAKCVARLPGPCQALTISNLASPQECVPPALAQLSVSSSSWTAAVVSARAVPKQAHAHASEPASPVWMPWVLWLAYGHLEPQGRCGFHTLGCAFAARPVSSAGFRLPRLTAESLQRAEYPCHRRARSAGADGVEALPPEPRVDRCI